MKLALHDVRLGGRQARDHDLADPRELAFLHGIARRDRPVLVGRAQAHRRTSVSAPLIELLHLVPRLLGTGRVPGIARTESDRLVNRLGVEDAVAGDGDRGDHSPRALDDRDDDPRVGAVVAEGHARGADLRRREPLRAVILAHEQSRTGNHGGRHAGPVHDLVETAVDGQRQDAVVDLDVLLEALLDEETAEDADRDQPGGPRLHLLGQLLGGERREPFEGDALDDDARALGDLELHDALAGVAAERSGHLHEVVTRLVIAPLDLIGARPHLDLVDDPVVGKDQPLAKYGLGERLPPHELHTGQRALGDLQTEVDRVRRGVEGRLERRHARLEEALGVQGALERAHAVAKAAVLELVTLIEVERLAKGLLLGAREPPDLDTADPRFLPGLDGDRHRSPIGGGILAHVEPRGGREIALATQPGEDVVSRALEALGIGRPSERECRGGGEVGGVETELAGPVQALEERAPRDAKAEPDPSGLVDRLDLDAVEDAEGPQPIEALAHPRARERLAGQAREELFGRRPGESMARDDLDGRHRGSRRRLTGPGDRGQQYCDGHREGPHETAGHRNLKRKITSPPTPPLNACSPATSTGPNS